MTDDQSLTTRLEEAKDGDILSEVKENNPYHVIYEKNEGLEARAKWYVVHTYSGHELKVAEQLKVRIASMNVEGKIFEVVIPAQDKIQVKKGQKKTVKEKILPGYILIKMIVDDQSWLAVRTTQGVTAFIGSVGKRLLSLRGSRYHYEVHGSQSSQVQEHLHRRRNRPSSRDHSPTSFYIDPSTKPKASSRFLSQSLADSVELDFLG